MIQPDPRLFRSVMGIRMAVIIFMLIVYSVTWLVLSTSTQFAIVSGILAADGVLWIGLYLLLSPRNRAALVHLSLIIDTIATSGIILSTGYEDSTFPLFYLLICLAGGVLYGRQTGLVYLVAISLVNISVLLTDVLFPLYHHRRRSQGEVVPYFVMGAALPVATFSMLLGVSLTQRGRYLQALYENLTEGLLILDDVGNIIEANSRAGEMTNRTLVSLTRLKLIDLASNKQKDADFIESHLKQCLQGAAVSFEMDVACGEASIPVEISASRIEGLSPIHIQVFLRDVSEWRKMEAEIRRQNEELRRINQELQIGRDLAMNASRMKSQFLANMSHELRTPLNSIIGYTQFVLQDKQRPLPADQREDLSRVLISARHLLELINGILDLARIESGRESITLSMFQLDEIVDSVIAYVTPMAKEKDLALGGNVVAGMPPIQSDEKKLRQILINLVSNAVKFTEQGTVEVECRLAANDQFVIEVVDSGIGIPRDQFEEVFSEFHQVDPGIHKKYGGTGLGLAITRRLVELLKGTVSVQSELGKGSVFTVSLPVSIESSYHQDEPIVR